MIASGSQNIPVGALFFEEDGTMRLSVMSSLDEYDSATITLISDYFQYALAREDWMLSFVNQMLVDHPDASTAVNIKQFSGSHLHVIDGGKNDASGSQ